MLIKSSRCQVATLLCLLYAGTYLGLGGSITASYVWALIAVPLIWLSVVDLANYTIPDASLVLLLAVSAIQLGLVIEQPIWINLVTACATTALLWLIGEFYYRFRETEGLGIGDAKLFGCGVFLLGIARLPELVLLSSLGGLVAVLISQKKINPKKPKGIPFGPFIAYAIFVLSLIDPILI